MRQYLEKFARRVLSIYLYDDADEQIRANTERIVERLLKDLAGELVTSKAKVEVVGVGLQSNQISLDAGIIIRRPTKADLEKTVRTIGLSFHDPFTKPSAILDVEARVTPGNNMLIQTRVEQCVALLRLFNVGSVRYISYDMWSDSLLDFMAGGTITSGERGSALETYVIKSDEESKLKQFWQKLSVLLPKDIYDFQKQISHITLAYDRYSDALLHNGIVERRVANAVMGLEALFLDESQELSYRLGLRISKVLSMVGKNPLGVREVIQDAYAIRSAFAHGGHLTYKAKQKLDRRYGDVKKLLHCVLDYLRLSIVIMILSRISKEELVDLIDDALLDSAKHQELQSRVSDAKALVGT